MPVFAKDNQKSATFDFTRSSKVQKLTDEEVKNVFINNDEELLVSASTFLLQKSSEELLEYIDFIFAEAIDTRRERVQAGLWARKANPSYIPKLIKYLESDNEHQRVTATYFLTYVGEDAYEILLDETEKNTEKAEVTKQNILSALQLKTGKFSKEQALTLIYNIDQYKCDRGVTLLNAIFAQQDFSSKAKETLLACLQDTREKNISYYAASRIEKYKRHWSQDEIDIFIASLEKRLQLERNMSEPSEKAIMSYDLALFSLGKITASNTATLVKNLESVGTYNKFKAASLLIVNEVETEKAKAVFLKELFNGKSTVRAEVTSALRRLEVKIDVLLPDIIREFKKEPNEKIRRKYLLYLNGSANNQIPDAAKSLVHKRSAQEQQEVLDVFKTYIPELQRIAQNSKAEHAYVEMILNHLSSY